MPPPAEADPQVSQAPGPEQETDPVQEAGLFAVVQVSVPLTGAVPEMGLALKVQVGAAAWVTEIVWAS